MGLSVHQRIETVLAQIEETLLKCNRKSEEVRVVPAIKKRSWEDILSVISHPSISAIAENRIEAAEARWKFPDETVTPPPPQKELALHLIGHLQSRKVKRSVELFDLIESVDSPKLLRSISQAAVELEKTQKILIRLNPLQEEQKDGFQTREELREALTLAESLPNLHVMGAMTMAPFVKEEKTIRRCFSLTREWWLAEKKREMGETLSMGMSNDFLFAVKEGSTILRLGTILFEESP